MPEAGTLIKIGKQEHIAALHDEGLLYMNTLPYYWEIEDGEVRGDPHDGIDKLLRGESARISSDDGTEIPVTVIGWNLRIHPINPDEINLFCMYSLRRSTFPVDDRAHEFGDTALILTRPQEFLDRIGAAMRDQNARGHGDLVEYVPDNYAGEIGPFRKLQKFSWQSEWRLVTYHGPKGPRTLSIGCLHDISKIVSVAELNQFVSFT